MNHPAEEPRDAANIMKKPTVKVVTNDQNPEPFEIIASSIIEVARGMKALNASRLKRSAIVALIHDRSKLGKTQIEIVLNNLEALERDWLKPTTKP
jgi:hypothetical protein